MTPTYCEAGVSIEAGNELVRRIGPLARATARPGVVTGIGGFSALFDLEPGGYRHPLIVSSTDGAGTKVMVAQQVGDHSGIGIDTVAMCVNDIVTCGAEPLFFLDYFVTGRLDLVVAEMVIASIAEGCRRAGCSLIGGETAEHPGHMEPGSYDVAGFSVGIVERDRLIDGKEVRPGDCIIGMASSGLHSNGFSLVRHVIGASGVRFDAAIPDFGRTLGEELLQPTTIYVPAVRELCRAAGVRGLAHITGGGLVENVPRVLPNGLGVRLDPRLWPAPPVFDFISRLGRISRDEMYRTFNMGLGMVAIVSRTEADRALDVLAGQGIPAWVVGEVVSSAGVVFEEA